MKQISKAKQVNRVISIIYGNEGASLVLVSIIAILVVSAILILRTTTNAMWASANKQLSQDQAYEMATSLGESIDVLISSKEIPLDTIYQGDGYIFHKTTNTGLANSSVEATVTTITDSTNRTVYEVNVTATSADATYIYTARYTGSGTSYKRQY